MDEWIPISYRPPRKDEYGKVLVTYIPPSGGAFWKTVIIAHYSDLMGIAKPCFYIGEVGKESFQNITEHVIAWMPSPKPYDPWSKQDIENFMVDKIDQYTSWIETACGNTEESDDISG